MKKIFCFFVIFLFAGCSNKQQRLPGYEGPESFDIHLLPDEWEYLRLNYFSSEIGTTTTTHCFFQYNGKNNTLSAHYGLTDGNFDDNSSDPTKALRILFPKSDWDMTSLDTVLKCLGENGFEMCGTMGELASDKWSQTGDATFYFKRKLPK